MFPVFALATHILTSMHLTMSFPFSPSQKKMKMDVGDEDDDDEE